MDREVRYCTTDDGVRIAYAMRGRGPFVLICPQFMESFSLIPTYEPNVEEFLCAFEDRWTVIVYDIRGCGMSQRDAVEDLGPDAQSLDLEAVISAIGGEVYGLIAWSAATGAALRYVLRRPGRISRLVLGNGGTRLTDGATVQGLAAFAAIARANWPIAAQTIADLGARDQDPTEAAQLVRIIRNSATGETVARIFEAETSASDIKDELATIATPTLVMHHLDNTVMPVSVARSMAATIPNARLVLLPGRSGWYTQGNALEIMKRFLDEGRPEPDASSPAASPSAFRTVLFTDIVGHTEMMRRLGDEKGRDVLREHERITRDTLEQHGGAEVKTMGDGFLASFGSVTKAMDCVSALQRAFAAHSESMPEPLHVRVGLDAGEPIEEDGDLFGSTVILASRIASKAGAGEILIPDTLRHLLAGKSYVYIDRGDATLKGFDDPMRLYEVSWRR